jgi:hypothetical protein
MLLKALVERSRTTDAGSHEPSSGKADSRSQRDEVLCRTVLPPMQVPPCGAQARMP